MNKPPTTFAIEGRQLWHWAAERYDIEGTQPLLGELCQIADRLAAVRTKFRRGTPDGRLISAEVKLIAQFTRAWKLLGLADSDAVKRPVGRPAGMPARRADVA
jgi:hypothetical protein